MSDVPSIVIKFEVSIDSSLILEELLANNWSPNHSDSNVLPLGDKEMFNWVDIKNYTVGDLLDLFKNK